ncbi:SCO3242 family prenyltransferase [Streptomyces sp. G45]|uniref:SCO3242 family prenyltransferase n=1 Tax=Streptomyces sp. G45 TaxID=3406627 RepID=UPI003C15E81C
MTTTRAGRWGNAPGGGGRPRRRAWSRTLGRLWGGSDSAAPCGPEASAPQTTPGSRTPPDARTAPGSGSPPGPRTSPRPAARLRPSRGGPGTRPRPEASPGARARAWVELLRLPALFTVPGDALAGAATGLRPGRGTLLAIGSSLCLYEAGMALNDWADRAEDAVDRPHRPIPSGRITPTAALTAAAALTTAGLALAARAGRPALTVATALAGTVWAYDLGLKRTPAGPATMAMARGLDLLLGATATVTATTKATARRSRSAPTASPTGHTRPTGLVLRPMPAPGWRLLKPALPAAATLGAHTLAVTSVSRQETQGGSVIAPLGALATTLALTRAMANPGPQPGSPPEGQPGPHPNGQPDLRPAGGPGAAGLPAERRSAGRRSPRRQPVQGSPGERRPADRRLGERRPTARLGLTGHPHPAPSGRAPESPGTRDLARTALALTYATTAARPYWHAALNPSPPLTQRAVGGGIRALIPLQAVLAARSGSLGTALLTAALAPAARRFARKVSIT